MKRLTTILMTLTLVAALAATLLSLTMQSSPQQRALVSQVLIAVSMAGLVLLAAFGGRRRRPEAAVSPGRAGKGCLGKGKPNPLRLFRCRGE